MGKNPLFSKTIWLNLLGSAALLLQGELGFLLPPEWQAIGLLVANLGMRLITREPIDWSQIKLPPRRALGVLLMAASLASLPLMSGCALKVTEEQPVLTELAVRAAVGRVLDEHPSWVEPARAITADAIRALNESDQVTLAGLEAYVIQRIPWAALAPDEEELLRVLIVAVKAELAAYLVQHGIQAPEEVALRVATVLGWIYQSAEIRAARAGG